MAKKSKRRGIPFSRLMGHLDRGFLLLKKCCLGIARFKEGKNLILRAKKAAKKRGSVVGIWGVRWQPKCCRGDLK